MKTVAEAIGVSRSNLADRLQELSKKRIGRPPPPDDELVSKINAVIAELPTYGYRPGPRRSQAAGAGCRSKTAQSQASLPGDEGSRPATNIPPGPLSGG